MKRAVTPSFFGLLLTIGCAAPKRVNWPDMPTVVPVYIEASDSAAKTDSGNMAAMLDAIESDLREESRSVEIVVARAGERAPVPRLELRILASDSGDQEMRKAGHVVPGIIGSAASIASSGSMVVEAFIVLGGGQERRYLGRFESSSLGALSEEAVAAGESNGHAIARKALK